MNLGWAIALVVAIGIGVLYYRDRQRVLALREKEAEIARKAAEAQLAQARAVRIKADAEMVARITERANLMREPSAEEWVITAEAAVQREKADIGS